MERPREATRNLVRWEGGLLYLRRKATESFQANLPTEEPRIKGCHGGEGVDEKRANHPGREKSILKKTNGIQCEEHS